MCELVSQTASSLTFPRSLSLLPSSQNPPTNLGYLQFWCCGAKIFHWSPFFLRAVQTKLTRSQSHVALLMLGEVLAWWRATSRSSMCCKTSKLRTSTKQLTKNKNWNQQSFYHDSADEAQLTSVSVAGAVTALLRIGRKNASSPTGSVGVDLFE